MDVDLLTRLCETPGAPGREARIREVVRTELAPVSDTIEEDPLGSLVARRAGGGGPRLMLAAHMDEIGFMVTHVEDGGFLRLIPLGGFDPKTLTAQRVIVHGREDLLGVLGGKAVHLMSDEEKKRAPKLDDYYVDVGLPADRVKELVRPGDVVTRERALARLGDLVTCKSLDNRAGLYVMIQAMKALGDHECEVIAVASVQEEVGLRGARVATARIRPQIGLAIDITLANDGPGIKPHERVTTVGGGAAVKVFDGGTIVPTAVVDHLLAVGEERGIPHPAGGAAGREHGHARAVALGRGGRRRLRLDPHPLRPPGGGVVPSGRPGRLGGPRRGVLRDGPAAPGVMREGPVALRPTARADADALLAIHETPGVREWWGAPAEGFPFDDEDATRFTVLVDDRIAGLIQFYEEEDPEFRHASIDVFLDPAVTGRGHGTAAIRLLVRYLFRELGHHRITIDPAVDNVAAVRSYGKVGFRPVGTLEAAWRDGDGAWRDLLLMELVDRDGITRR